MADVLDVCVAPTIFSGTQTPTLMLNRGQYIGWTGLIRVDGNTFTWMGAPKDIEAASQVAFEYTSTKSIFTIEVDDKVVVKVTFLSPLTPHDFKRLSLIFSYLSVEVSSLDGSEHDVQLYTDISAGE